MLLDESPRMTGKADSYQLIVVAERPFIVVGGPLNMYIVAYRNREYMFDMKDMHIMYIQPPAKDEKPKMTPGDYYVSNTA